MKEKINFIKMAGAGNDFLMIEKPRTNINLKKLAQKACDRTNGVGADGLIVIGPSKKSDYRMRIINADGSEAEMCGNGARCFAAYVAKNKKLKDVLFSFETLAGEILGRAKGEEAVVRLSDPAGYKAGITITVNGRKLKLSYIDTGVPHVIIFVHDLSKINVRALGEKIRHHKKFRPRGTNVNFVEPLRKDLVNARTYERGVEDETKACGTGSVAAAIVSYMDANPNIRNKTGAKMKVKTRGGEILQVTFDITEGKIHNVWLRGSAKFIAEGAYYV